MRLIAKQLLAEVKNTKGWIVYVMDYERPIEAEICKLDDVQSVIKRYKAKYKI